MSTLVDIHIIMYLRYSQLIIIVKSAHQNLREKHASRRQNITYKNKVPSPRDLTSPDFATATVL